MTHSSADVAPSWLGPLTSEARARLEPVLHYDEFASGDVVIREGDASDWLGLVLDGEGVVERTIDARDHAGAGVEIVAAVSRGDVIGEMAFLEQKPRSATVRARGPMRVARLPRETFRALMRSDPDIAESLVGALLRTLSARLRDSTDTLMALYSAGRQIGAARSLDDVCTALLEHITKVVPSAAAGVVATLDDEGCRPVVSFGLPTSLPVPFPLARDGQLFRALLARSAAVVVGPDDGAAAEVAFFKARWCLITELTHETRVIGIVALCSNAEANPFQASHEAVTAVLANQAAAAVARHRSKDDS